MAFWSKFLGGEKVKDPVCGMTVNPQVTQFETEYQGKTYYFCVKNCQEQFEAAPQKYTNDK